MDNFVFIIAQLTLRKHFYRLGSMLKPHPYLVLTMAQTSILNLRPMESSFLQKTPPKHKNQVEKTLEIVYVLTFV
jgi:hypothetical protein